MSEIEATVLEYAGHPRTIYNAATNPTINHLPCINDLECMPRIHREISVGCS